MGFVYNLFAVIYNILFDRSIHIVTGVGVGKEMTRTRIYQIEKYLHSWPPLFCARQLSKKRPRRSRGFDFGFGLQSLNVSMSYSFPHLQNSLLHGFICNNNNYIAVLVDCASVTITTIHISNVVRFYFVFFVSNVITVLNNDYDNYYSSFQL